MTKMEEILLESLSFYQPMTLEQILLDIDKDKIMQERQLTLDDLKETLKILEKRKLLKTKGEDKARTWLRVLPKRPWYKRVMNFLFK